MSRFIESIQLRDGKFNNLFYHEQRMSHALYIHFGQKRSFNLEELLRADSYPVDGLYKCRVVYDATTFRKEYLPYEARKVRSLRVVEDNDVSYPFKYEDRTVLNRLFDQRGACDDVLIVKQGKVTDCSYSNIVFRHGGGEWFTPSTPLLDGTMRQQLIDQKKIQVREIERCDIRSFACFKIINAMLGFDGPEIDVSNIVF